MSGQRVGSVSLEWRQFTSDTMVTASWDSALIWIKIQEQKEKGGAWLPEEWRLEMSQIDGSSRSIHEVLQHHFSGEEVNVQAGQHLPAMATFHDGEGQRAELVEVPQASRLEGKW